MLARACRSLLPRAAALRPPAATRSYHEVPPVRAGPLDAYAACSRCTRGCGCAESDRPLRKPPQRRLHGQERQLGGLRCVDVECGPCTYTCALSSSMLTAPSDASPTGGAIGLRAGGGGVEVLGPGNVTEARRGRHAQGWWALRRAVT
jgi:hypothetical protein